MVRFCGKRTACRSSSLSAGSRSRMALPPRTSCAEAEALQDLDMLAVRLELGVVGIEAEASLRRSACRKARPPSGAAGDRRRPGAQSAAPAASSSRTRDGRLAARKRRNQGTSLGR